MEKYAEAWRLGNQSLVKAFSEEVFKSSYRSSFQEEHYAARYYLEGVLLARMENQIPPVEVGDQVRIKASIKEVHALNERAGRGLITNRGVPLTVAIVGYKGHGQWWYSFRIEPSGLYDQYPAESFRKVRAKAKVLCVA